MHAFDDGQQGAAECGDPVFDAGRNLGEDDAFDDSVGFQFAQLIGECLLVARRKPSSTFTSTYVAATLSSIPCRFVS